MKKVFVFLSMVILIMACQTEKKQQTDTSEANLTILTNPEDAVKFENLNLYPILASKDFLDQNDRVANFIPLNEAIQASRFRISEKKPFGRFEDRTAVNTLTVQNKTNDTIFLMSGDVVRGGLQDRVLAENMIVLPRSIRDIEVFCVEHNRWNYKVEEGADPSDQDKKIFAFRGYYNVASNDIRKTLAGSRSQQEVWDHVSAIRAKNGADSPTQAYAGLEQSEAFTAARTDYLDYFKNAFANRDDVVGLVAVNGGKIISTDIFGHPTLFQKQYQALLHSYVTDAISSQDSNPISVERLELNAKRILKEVNKPTKSTVENFRYQGLLVHFTSL